MFVKLLDKRNLEECFRTFICSAFYKPKFDMELFINNVREFAPNSKTKVFYNFADFVRDDIRFSPELTPSDVSAYTEVAIKNNIHDLHSFLVSTDVGLSYRLELVDLHSFVNAITASFCSVFTEGNCYNYEKIDLVFMGLIEYNDLLDIFPDCFEKVVINW